MRRSVRRSHGILHVLGVALLVGIGCAHAEGTDTSPFALDSARIPVADILSGGPGKDGIPALVAPRVLQAEEADYLRDTDRVLGVRIGDAARAYPLRILNWHELVNDTLGKVPILITYCPLCGSGVVFRRDVGGQPLEFGVSGLLYQSNVLMYDRTHRGLWSQLRMEAVTGPLAGTKLRSLPLEVTTWDAWREAHPDTTVLAAHTGYRRDYASEPYRGYADTPTLMFPVRHRDDRRHPKEWVVGIVHAGIAKAYPFQELARAPKPVTDRINGDRFTIDYEPSTATARVRGPRGEVVPVTVAFWFAWAAFHPETLLFEVGTAAKETGDSVPSPRNVSELFPVAIGNWWTYEERAASGELSAVERWQVHGRDAGGYLLRTHQVRSDGRAAADETSPAESLTTEEHVEVRSDGVVRTFTGSERGPMYLIRAPVDVGRTWVDDGGRCRITAVEESVRAAARWFEGCTQVTCEQAAMLRITSSYAPGVGLVRQEVWFGGFGALGVGAGRAEIGGEQPNNAPTTTLVLTAWGSQATTTNAGP